MELIAIHYGEAAPSSKARPSFDQKGPVQPTQQQEKGAKMTARTRLTETLTEALQPVSLEVIDESHHHAGHGGWRPEGETHFRVKVVSAVFAGKTRLQRHRLVNDLAEAELKAGLHALAIEARTPEEAA